jgi:tetratricopeptide (TPR) repeat protein
LEGKAHTEKALKLNHQCADAYLAKGIGMMTYEWDWPEAEKNLKKAISLNGNSAFARAWHLLFLDNISRDRIAAFTEAKKAIEVEPLNPTGLTQYGNLLRDQKKYEEALSYYNQALEIDNTLRFTVQGKIICLFGANRPEEALAFCLRQVELVGREHYLISLLGRIYKELKKLNEAEGIYTEMKERSKREYISPHLLGELALSLGHLEEAIAYYREAVAQRSGLLLFSRDLFESIPELNFVHDSLNFPEEQKKTK